MHVLRYGAESRKPTEFIKIGNACIKIWNDSFSALCDIFLHCEIDTNSKNFGRPARAYNYYACGYLITRADIDMP